ncbi:MULTISPECIES: hypothetical protein [unclassified Frankia]|uniref:hypothetical protein n=1 Tax=unclassified Frankia TaxID=2632575 RepID=UPI002AD2D74B|nr:MULTISPECIES: hypothetical protein [unclassified Frankia]
MNAPLLFATTFLACTVEAVEAFTIVLAVGISRGWRPVSLGTAGGTAVLAVVVAAAGPALARVPLAPLRLVVGVLLLAVGVGWLRKAVLRAAGSKPLRDEQAVFTRYQAAAVDAGPVGGHLDGYGFTLAFKAVLLEGLEVALIVVTTGATSGRTPLTAAAAGCAVLTVTAVGAAVVRPLTRIPENTIKFVVGVLTTSFGVFWAADGAGLDWPAGDGALPGLIALTTMVALTITVTVTVTAHLRRRVAGTPPP